MSVKEIEEAIVQLSEEEFSTLMAWLDEYRARMWERQIETDLDSGRLDQLLAEVDAEIEEGLAKPL